MQVFDLWIKQQKSFGLYPYWTFDPKGIQENFMVILQIMEMLSYGLFHVLNTYYSPLPL